MMDCLCVAKVNINVSGQRLTQLKSCGFCGGTGVLPSISRKRVSYIMMNPVVEGIRPSYIMMNVSEGGSGGCTPSNVLFNSGALDNADGIMTARYRINGGEWEDYDGDPNEWDVSIPKDFLMSLYWDDWQLITDTNGGDAAFIFHHNNMGLSGVHERLEDNDNSVMEIVDPEFKTVIDFQVTSRDEYDIVWKLFGEDTTIHSCALANFAAE